MARQAVTRAIVAPANTSTTRRGLSRLGLSFFAGGKGLPPVSAMREMGVSGTGVFGGQVRNPETSPKWSGATKYRTASELVVNVSIVAAGVHHFLNLLSHPNWQVVPASDKDPAAQEAADFVESVIYDMKTAWPRVVRRAGTYRFYGFGVQEWTAKRRPDGRTGFIDIEPRPQHTIEQWEVSDDGTVTGMWQRSPQTFELLGLPRGKLLYLVEDTLTDSPEGLGVFRHVGETYERLKRLQALEVRAFERDLRGTPIGRAPISLINQKVAEGELTQADANDLINGLKEFVKLQVKESDTGIVLDSMPYESVAQDGQRISGLMQWGLDLLTGSANGLGELNDAIDRLQREMARVIGVEHLMMGGERYTGNRALSQDKSRNLYLIANSVLTYIAESVRNDLITPLWTLNGLPEETKPWLTTEDVTFKDVEGVAQVLRDMSIAGAVLGPDDPVINDVRDLMGVSRQVEPFVPVEEEEDLALTEGEMT